MNRRPDWFLSFGVGLTGQHLGEATGTDGEYPPTAAGLVAWLAAAGWSAGDIAEFAQHERVAGRRWPQIHDDDLGPAQLAAMQVAVLNLLGNPQLRQLSRPTMTKPPTADDQRLLREVPPHHV